MSRRDFMRISTMLAAASVLPSPIVKAEDRPLRIGYLPITDASPLLIAHALGYYQEEGVEVDKPTLFRSWAQIVEAFIAGQIDVIHILAPTALWMRYSGKIPAKIVAWNHVNGSALTVRPDIVTLDRLAGETVAIPFWYSIHNVALQYLLREHNLTVAAPGQSVKSSDRAVKLVVMPPPDMVSALAIGKIAGFIVAEPFNALAETVNAGKIYRFTGDLWQSHACCVVFMHEADLTKRPEWSQKVVNALVKAQSWLRSNRAEGARLLSKAGEHKYTPHEPKVLERALSHYDTEEYGPIGAIRNPEWQGRRVDFQPYPYPSYTERLVELLKQTYVEGDSAFLNDLDPAFVAGDLVDDRWVRNAIEKAGGLSSFGIEGGYRRQEILKI
ncbi:MAG: ABC transporter substrate-binding protein [Gammaproteobacteria bacterium HGW-Gammaproteobacteria-10]|nr:MAG: ABC transporter substrate-binding protein [Gammaproteobacteria bacterium HGW-Gammaproteobacteria-10]